MHKAKFRFNETKAFSLLPVDLTQPKIWFYTFELLL